MGDRCCAADYVATIMDPLVKRGQFPGHRNIMFRTHNDFGNHRCARTGAMGISTYETRPDVPSAMAGSNRKEPAPPVLSSSRRLRMCMQTPHLLLPFAIYDLTAYLRVRSKADDCS